VIEWMIADTAGRVPGFIIKKEHAYENKKQR